MSLLNDRIKDKHVRFVSARRGALIYQCDDGFKFEVPIDEMGDGEFKAEDKAIYFMRWIRKGMES